MDEVVNQLEAAAITKNEENQSSFENLYKNRGRTGQQEERRNNLLETQKNNRNTKLDKFRGILDLVEAVEEDIFQTPRTHWQPTIFVSGYNKIPNYCDVLMASEWMYEKPKDLAENWLVVPCPKGTRMLVVAHKGTTKCFNKYGNYRFECRTELPGGNPSQAKHKKRTVVLDCFYQKDTSTMYVLDILAWNNCVMTEGEAGFRHFWMSGQLEQIPELQLITNQNKLIFKVIPKLPCDNESLSNLLSIYPYYNHNMPAVDGLLFYHQKAQYFSGETPLVAWLFPYMAHEVLGEDIKVHKAYMLEKPFGYTNYTDFIVIFESKKSRKRQNRIFKPKKVYTADMEDAEASTSSAAANGSGSCCTEVEGDTAAASSSMNCNGGGSSSVPKGGDVGASGSKTNLGDDNMEAMVSDIVTDVQK